VNVKQLVSDMRIRQRVRIRCRECIAAYERIARNCELRVSLVPEGRYTVAHSGSCGVVKCGRIKPRRGGKMGHSYSRNHIHLVFSTKDRRDIIPKELQPNLWAYMAGVCKNYEMIAVAIGGTENHIHILFHLSPKLALAKAVQLLKSNSSKWMGEQGIDFSWQEGYGAFSVSSSNLEAVARYIRTQGAHHRKFSFEEEFHTLLKKHGVEYNPKYILG
jgi:putative transposase